jgi:thioredoxin-related protein
MLLLFLATETFGFELELLPKYSTVYDQKVNPYIALNIALKKVKISQKPILLMVGSDWCKWCGEFENFLDDHQTLAEDFYTSFEVVRVYYGKGINQEAQSLLQQFPPLKGTPHFYILNSNAKLLKSIDTGYLERGYSYNIKKVKGFIEKNKLLNKEIK